MLMLRRAGAPIRFTMSIRDYGSRLKAGTTSVKPQRIGYPAMRRKQPPSRRFLAGGVEPGIDAALEAREGFQAMLVHERQQLHQDYAGDVARGVDPEIGVGEPCPGEAAGAAAFRGLGGVDQEREPPFLHHVRIEIDMVGEGRQRRDYLR